MDQQSTFSKNLKLARNARGYTQKEVAKSIGVSNSSYSQYESGGREPSIKTIEKIAHVLRVSIDELFGLYNFTSKDLIRESSKDYVKAACTWEEYYDLPDGEHAELVNGQLYL